MSVLVNFRRSTSVAYISQSETITDICYKMISHLHSRYIHTLGDPLIQLCMELEKQCKLSNRYRTDDLEQISRRKIVYNTAKGILDEICTHLSRIERLTLEPTGNTLWVNSSNETMSRTKATTTIDNYMIELANTTGSLYKSLKSLSEVLNEKEQELKDT